MSRELATKYLPYVDEIFTKESKKDLLTNQDFTFDGAHTVKVYKITTAPMNNYSRNSGLTRYGVPADLDATTETLILSNDRSFTFVIDALDANETAGTLAGATALARQIREVVIPEVDAYVYGVMCEKAGTKPAETALTPENIYDEIIKASAVLDDALVPETGRVLTVTPATYLLMKKCSDITMDTEIGNDMRLKGVIANVDGAITVKIAPARLPANFGFMLAHPCATVAPTKLEDYNTHVNPPGINGTLVEGRIVYDAFVLENKEKAIYYQAIPETAEQRKKREAREAEEAKKAGEEQA